MADLVAHDMAASHQKILLSVLHLYTIPGWVVPAEGESAHTLRKAGPSKAERPAVLRVQVLHRDGEHRVGVCRPVCGHNVEEPTFVTSFVLDRGLRAYAVGDQRQEVSGDLFRSTSGIGAPWNDLSLPYDFN